MAFKRLGLIEPLVRAVLSEGYHTPTDIQTQAIPHVLEGKDLLGCAQTGTGKTAAFALPILHRLHGRAPSHGRHEGHRAGGRHPDRPIRAMILTPTRELAAQIGESFAAYGRHTGLRHATIFGGVGQGPQVAALRRGVDVLVATPGRLLDLMGQGHVSLQRLEIFVLDEADRMLDMGFIHDIRRVIAELPERRQTLMFSATMPGEIRQLAGTILKDPVEVKIAAESPAADTVEQAIYHVEQAQKAMLLEQLLQGGEITRALVFTRTKRGADRVARYLSHAGLSAEAIHANKSQNARVRALESFKKGRTRVLVASDIASRGLDVEEISHVINYDLPNVPETYVHRIGRTGRAGAAGKAISFCTQEQREELRDIERLLGRAIPVLHHPSIKSPPRPAPSHAQAQGKPGGQQHRTHHATTTAKPAGHAATKHASPQQQKNHFWQSRRRRRPQPPGHRPPRRPE